MTRLAKQLGGVTTIRVPAALDMGLVGLAEGSLYIGFSADEDDAAELTGNAIDTIAIASRLVASDQPLEALAAELLDPAVRDMAVAAIRQLSPSGHAGITEIALLGRRVHHRVSLSTETRRHARRLMAQPPLVMEQRTLPSTTSFVGTIRELDLDASRFELRNVDGSPGGVRCAHELDEQDIKTARRSTRTRERPTRIWTWERRASPLGR